MTRLLCLLLAATALAAGCQPPMPRYDDDATRGNGPATRRDGGITRRDGDIIAGGRTVAISDSIPGDVMVAGSEISFTGLAGGDYLGAGGRQEIGGRVLGDVRAAGGAVRLAADVGHNATIAGGRIAIVRGGAVRGNAYLAGGAVRVQGAVGRFLRIMGGDVALDGLFGGDVHVEAERLRLGPNAIIAGNLRYRVPPEDVTIDPGAEIHGRVIALPPRPRPPIAFLHVLWLLGFLLAGGVLVALFPRAMAAAAAALRRRPGAAFGFGLLWVIVVPIAVVILALTLIGLPLALIAAALYAISLYLGRAVVALWLGRQLLRGRAAPGRGRILLAFLIGAVILLLVGLIPIVGPIVTILATLAGLGALVTAFRGRRAESETGSAAS